MSYTLIFPGLIFAVSVISFVLFAYDKHQAYYCKFRIPEFILLAVTVLGGAIGTIPGMYFFRHKTRKPLFKITGWLFFLLTSLFLLWCFYNIWRNPLLANEYFSDLTPLL